MSPHIQQYLLDNSQASTLRSKKTISYTFYLHSHASAKSTQYIYCIITRLGEGYKKWHIVNSPRAKRLIHLIFMVYSSSIKIGIALRM